MQRAQVGQKHKLIPPSPPVRVSTSKKRMKLEQSPLCQHSVPKISSNTIKIETDNDDYSRTTPDIKHSNLLEMQHKSSNFQSVKAEPVDVYAHRSHLKQKMYYFLIYNIIT